MRSPGLIYHPHLAPASTLPATLFEATSHLHSLVPESVHLSTSSHAAVNDDKLAPSWKSFARLFQIPPVHADAVGEAVCRSIELEHVEGPVGVQEMRRMLGFEPVGVGA